MPVSRMFQRTILACSSLNTPAICSAVQVGSSPSAGSEVRLDLRLDGVDGGIALLLVGVLVGGAQFVLDQPEHLVLRASASARRSEVARLLGGHFGELDDRVDDRLEAACGRT